MRFRASRPPWLTQQHVYNILITRRRRYETSKDERRRLYALALVRRIPQKKKKPLGVFIGFLFLDGRRQFLPRNKKKKPRFIDHRNAIMTIITHYPSESFSSSEVPPPTRSISFVLFTLLGTFPGLDGPGLLTTRAQRVVVNQSWCIHTHTSRCIKKRL